MRGSPWIRPAAGLPQPRGQGDAGSHCVRPYRTTFPILPPQPTPREPDTLSDTHSRARPAATSVRRRRCEGAIAAHAPKRLAQPAQLRARLAPSERGHRVTTDPRRMRPDTPPPGHSQSCEKNRRELPPDRRAAHAPSLLLTGGAHVPVPPSRG